LVEKKKYVCLKCGNIFDSRAKTPRCSLCKSRKVVEYEFWIKKKQEIENKQNEEQKSEFDVVNNMVKPVKPGDNVDLTGEKPDKDVVELVVNGQKPVNHLEDDGEKSLVNGETNGESEKPLGPHNDEKSNGEMVKHAEKVKLKNIKKNAGISIPILPASFLVLVGVIVLIYWKRKEIWNMIDSLFGREKDQDLLLDYSYHSKNPLRLKIRQNLR